MEKVIKEGSLEWHGNVVSIMLQGEYKNLL